MNICDTGRHMFYSIAMLETSCVRILHQLEFGRQTDIVRIIAEKRQ